MIELRSDNAAGVAPEVLAAVQAANTGSALAYGGDDLTDHLQDVVRSVFDHPTARAFPVTSGTAANALALSATTPPWGAVLCHPSAHIITAEGGATSFFGGGAVMQGVGGEHALIEPGRLREALGAVRWVTRTRASRVLLSLTLPSDHGTVYRPDQVTELSSVAREFGLRTHVDGARIANAVAALGCSPAEVTWQAGVDVLSLGATKNGVLSAESIVVFDDRIAEELVYRTKRSGHVTSKMRFQSAQLAAYLHRRAVAAPGHERRRADGRAGGRAAVAGVVRRAGPGARGRQHGVRRATGRGDRRGHLRRAAVLPDGPDQRAARHELADHR